MRTELSGRDHETGRSTVRDPNDVSAPWDADNQAWWDWYVGLAHNEPHQETASRYGAISLEPDPRRVRPLRFEALARELCEPYPLTDAVVETFRTEGYVKLPGVLSEAAVVSLRREIVEVLEEAYGAVLDANAAGGSGTGGESARGTEGKAGSRFYSAEMVWLENKIIRLFVLSPRIAALSARLLGVDRVRLYHDNLMSKEPGCRRTPWHFDDHHFPLATRDVVTAWIPAEAIPVPMGPLTFARGMETWRTVKDVSFNTVDTSYDRQVAETFAQEGVEIDETAFDAGTVSFHHNMNFHSAGANRTPLSRCVLANTFYADGARVVDAPTMVSGDWEKFFPGVRAGEPAASPVNPVCWPAGAD